MRYHKKKAKISDNIQWGFKRKFEKADIFAKYKRFYGYAEKYDQLIPIQEEAEVVQKIFNLYLEGKSIIQIKKYLEKQNIKNSAGDVLWYTSTIDNMLSNEKYTGNTLLQKTFVKNYLTQSRAKNTGQRDRYYVEDSHIGIISMRVYLKVQEEKARCSMAKMHIPNSESIQSKYNGKYMFSNILVCGHCGSSFRRRTERRKIVWRCASRIEKGKSACNESPTLNEKDVEEYLKREICKNTEYDELLIKETVSRIKVYATYLATELR